MKHNLRKVCSILLIVSLVVSLSSVQIGQAAKKPKLNASRVSLKVGKSYKLKLKNIKKSKIKRAVYTSTKKKVATVSRAGKIQAKKAGKATIRCKLKLKNGKRYRLKCRVTVKAGTDDWEEPDEDEGWEDDDEDGVTQSPAASTSAPAGAVTSTVPVVSDAPAADPSTPTDMPDGNTSAPAESSQAPVVTIVPTGDVTSTPENSVKPTDKATTEPTVDVPISPSPTSTLTPQESNIPVETDAPTMTPSGSSEPMGGDTTPMPSATCGVFVEGALDASTLKDLDIADDGLNAFSIVHEMGLGINLGNTFEACGTWINDSSVTNFETAWGAPVTTKEMIQGMKSAGFRSVRIPVAWSNMMTEDPSTGTYLINPAYFDRVEEVTKWVLDEDMYAIINIHFDSGWWARFGSKDAAERTQAMVKYKSMWQQIANRFRDYGNHLIFESANEELGDRLNSTEDYENSGYYSTEEELYELTNQINQTFVSIIRHAGGKNETRFLLIAGYNTDIDKTCNGAYEMPKDAIPNHLMVSIHYYSPVVYCLVSEQDNSWGYAGSWGTEKEQAELREQISKMKVSFVNKGYPVIIGEYGVASEQTAENTYKRKEGKELFLRRVCEYALENGMCPVLWDVPTHAGCGVYNRKTCSMEVDEEAAVYLQLAEKAKNTEVYQPEQADSTPVWSGTIGNDVWNPIAPVASATSNNTMFLSQSGAAYAINQVDWSAYTNPVLTLKLDHTSDSVTSLSYKFDTQVNNKDNEYWPYIENNGKLSGTWNLASEKSIDLSSLNLSQKQTLYVNFTALLNSKAYSYQADITITISEKQ